MLLRKSVQSNEPLQNRAQESRFVWIDWENSIVAFTEQPGFVKVEFPSHAQMFSYVVLCAQNDYRIL